MFLKRIIIPLLIVFIYGHVLPAVAEEHKLSASIVLMIAEEEYKTEETVPAFAESELKPLGISFTTVMAEPRDSANFPGLEKALPTADLLFVSVRRRAPTSKQMQLIKDFVAAGKPLIGIRTASHAFAVKKNLEAGHAEWKDFDQAVLGGSYSGHYGNEAAALTIVPGAEDHPILRGVDMNLFSTHRLYKNVTLGDKTTALLMGTTAGQKDQQYVAWCNVVGNSRIFYTSLGVQEDFKEPAFRQLLKNSVLWALGHDKK